MNLLGSYNYVLVALSVFIAMFASYAALDLAGRVTAAGGWTRVVWLLGGAGAMGMGIWSMHYIGMLAFILPIPVAYHWPTVLLSLFAAILASAVALGVVSRQKMGWIRALAASVLMGAGIASMHYIGMGAMRLSAVCRYKSSLVVLSVVFAILISLAALWITFHFRDEKTGIGWEKLAGAVVMGAAIPVMHYTGMAAASFTPSGMPADLSHAVSISTLGTAGVAAVTFMVLGMALLTSWVDRRFAAQTLELQEEKLQRSEAYLAEAQKLSHTGSFGWNPSTGEIIWSEETFRIFQFDRAMKPSVELISQRVHPEDVGLVKQTIERAAQDGKDFDFEHRLLMPDGYVKYLRVVARPSGCQSGRLEFVGAVTDITERKRAEAELRMSEGYLAEAQRMTRSGSWAWNVRTGAVFWSQEIFRIYECDPEKTKPGWSFILEMVHPEDRPGVEQRAEMESTRKDIVDSEGDFRIVLPDGSVKHLHSIAHPVLDESGEIIEVVGTTVDVTERKLAEEKIRQSERELRQLIDLTPLHITAFGPDGSRLYNNQASLDFHGLTLEQWQTAPLDRLLHPQDAERAAGEVPSKFESECPFEIEARHRRKDGQYRWFLVRFNPIRDEQGRLIRWYAAATDIEDRKQVEQQLQNENVALREEIDTASMFEEIVGSSPSLHAVLSLLSKVAPTDSTVLITGETGTGKELVARAVHKRSHRSSRAFVSVNCAAIPRDLIASELFGHE